MSHQTLGRERKATADPRKRIILHWLDLDRPDPAAVPNVERRHDAVRRHGIDPAVTDNGLRHFGQLRAGTTNGRRPDGGQWRLQPRIAAGMACGQP